MIEQVQEYKAAAYAELSDETKREKDEAERYLETVAQPLGEQGLQVTTEVRSGFAARELAESLAGRTGLPLELWDERMSTARARVTDNEGKTGFAQLMVLAMPGAVNSISR